MWTAVSWLSQKTGINLDDANEVLNCSNNSQSQQQQQSSEYEEHGNESSKENQINPNCSISVTPLSGKRFRRSRWSPPPPQPPLSTNPSPGGGVGISSPPITPILVPTGNANYYNANASHMTHHTMPTVMVPTTGSKGGLFNSTSMMSPAAPEGVLSRHGQHSPASLQWRDIR